MIVDDHKLFRESLTYLLQSNDIDVTDSVKNGNEALEKARINKPDIILMDIGMDEINGIDATEKIKKELNDIKIIGLSMHSNLSYIKGLLANGASGYLLKSCSFNELKAAMLSVLNGTIYLGEEITNLVLSDYLDNEKHPKNNNLGLSDREIEILTLTGKGYSTREIAEKLFICVKTVGTHKQNIMKKLDLKKSADLLKFAMNKYGNPLN